MKRIPLKTRFLRKVDKTSSPIGCWLWTGSCTDDGYSQTATILSHSEKSHRISWKLFRGVIPKGLWVLHKCDVRSCVNPDHLYLGTHKDNMKDMVRRGRHVGNRRVKCP